MLAAVVITLVLIECERGIIAGIDKQRAGIWILVGILHISTKRHNAAVANKERDAVYGSISRHMLTAIIVHARVIVCPTAACREINAARSAFLRHWSHKERRTEKELILDVKHLDVTREIERKGASHCVAVVSNAGRQRVYVWKKTVAQAYAAENTLIEWLTRIAELPRLARRLGAVTAHYGQESGILQHATIEFSIFRVFATIGIFTFMEPLPRAGICEESTYIDAPVGTSCGHKVQSCRNHLCKRLPRSIGVAVPSDG